MFTSVGVTNTLSHFVSLLEPPSYKAAQTKTSGPSTQWFIIQDLVGLSMAFATYSLPPTQSIPCALTHTPQFNLYFSFPFLRLTFFDSPARSGLRTHFFFFFFLYSLLFFLSLFPALLFIVTASFGEVGGLREGN